MRAFDNDALICDFAEYYGVLDYTRLPVGYAASLADGLPRDSRIRMRMRKDEYTFQEQILINILDSVNLIMWILAQKGNKKKIKKPISIWKRLSNKKKNDTDDVMKFRTPEDFKAARERILKKVVK